MDNHEDDVKSPTRDTEHDPEAVKTAAERMHSTGHDPDPGDKKDMEPDASHDPDAVEDAAEKMHADRRP